MSAAIAVAEREVSAGHSRGDSGGGAALRLLALAEFALLLLILATAAGFRRLFVDWSFFPPMALAAIVSLCLAVFCERRGWRLLRTCLFSLAVAIVTLTLAFYAWTSFLGLPTFETLEQLGSDLKAVFGPFNDLKAPVEPLTGFVVAGAAAMWATALLSDWAGFRNWSPVEAALVPGSAFVFCSIFGRGDFQTAAAVLFIAAMLLFLLTHRVLRAASSRWIENEASRGSGALLRSGGFALAAAVALGAVAAPLLPGSDSPPLVSLRELNKGPGSRVVVSPLVDIQSRLVEQADVVAFTVESDVPAYWRLTALDDFNGNVWGSKEDFGDATGSLPGSVPSNVENATVTQEFEIEGLGGIWLPAAFEAQSISTDAEVNHSPFSSTIAVSRGITDSSDVTYTVESVIPQIQPVDLEAVASNSDDVDSRFLELPEDFSESASALARTVIEDAGAATPYEQAIALQDFFREGFTYNLDVAAGHGVDDIEHFLEVREGYCEQFSGSYAAMARAVGLPARVAVGFTFGEQDPENPSRYVVRGRHAHAWPEVHIDGYGWVAFEPTPGRGNPSASAYTGVPAAQDPGTGSGTDPEGTDASSPVTETTVTPPTSSTTTQPADNDVDAVAAAPPTDTTTPRSGGVSAGKVFLWVLLAAAVGYVVLMPVVVATREAPATPVR